jgi:Flp pilus assembly protein TadB
MADVSGQSAADLVRQAADQISALVRDEIRLAQAEFAEKGKHAAVGAGMFGSAGLAAIYGVGALAVAGGLALALVMPGWAAALVVAVVLFLVAGVQVLVGKRHLKQIAPLTPRRAMQSVRDDLDAVSTAVEERNAR